MQDTMISERTAARFDRQAMAELFAAAEHAEAETWKPQPGDKLGGRVVRDEQRTTKLETAARVLTLERYPDGAEVALWAFHTALARELDEHDVKVGDLLAVHYLGTGTTKDGHPFHRYKVAAKRVTNESAAADPIGEAAPF